MTKFIEALQAQIDREYRVRPKPIHLLAHPITLTEDYCRVDIQNRYLLQLCWNVPVWLDAPALDSDVEKARKEAMLELTRLVYGEIYGELSQLRYIIKYGETDKAIDCIDNVMKKIGIPIHD